MKHYLKHTASPLFGVIIIIPLAIYYEISMILVHRGASAEIRNAADVMFKRLFEQIGFDGPLAGIVMFACLFIITAILQGAHREKEGIKIHWHYYPVLIAESTLYAMLLFTMMSFSMSLMLPPVLAISAVDVGYCMGAGVYEELLFRAFLLQGLLLLAERLPGKTHLWRLSALILSSLLFSAAHYIGTAGDVFIWSTFFSRMLGGVLLGMIYMFRGLGAAAYTHTIYNIFTIIL